MSDERPTWAGPFHRRQIPRGIYAEFSKVEEERVEALDAIEQGQRLMFLVELADIFGAVEGVLAVDEVSIVGLWPNRRQRVMPQMATPTPGQYEDWALRMLGQIAASLAAAQQVSGPQRHAQLIEVVECLVALAQPFALGFEELLAFATLRSAVARHALGQTD